MSKVLIIEDDQIVANIYRNKFAVEGYEVEIALDGEAGLEKIQSFHPDAIVLDLMLPKVTGLDLMKNVRSQPEYRHLPIIVFSNTYLTNMVQDAWKAGATKCLSKANCSPRQVIDAVRSTLSGNGLAHTTADTSRLARPQTHPHASPGASHVNGHQPAPATASAPVPTPEHSGDADAQFQADLRKSFIAGFPNITAALRTILKSLVKAESDATRVKDLQDLYRRIHALTGNAGIAGMPQIAQVADALEALLKELYEKPKSINTSNLRTVATAIDFLGLLFQRSTAPFPEGPPPHILVVDDEAISRRAITYALDKAKLKCVNMEDPQVAYNLLLANKFDLIFLDVDMPGMNGFELCARLRELPTHKKTPVIFVTSLTDLESRANSMISGGNDYIAKPFLFMELAVKAIVYLLRGRLEAQPK
jgi:DNA-binding response OmpR family regulator/HPt (histidine-containing phosphotransfer) domain-containing protein